MYKKGNMGPLIASIIVIIVLIISGVYAMKERPLKSEVELTNDDIQALETQDTSTEIVDIEKDLNASNFDDLGLDLGTAEMEL